MMWCAQLSIFLMYQGVLFAGVTVTAPQRANEVLGVSQNPSLAEIDRAYLNAMRAHPSREQRDAIVEAHKILLNRWEQSVQTKLLELVQANGYLNMIRTERDIQFEDGDHSNSLAAKLGRSSPPVESERHELMRKVLVENVGDFLSQNPSYANVLKYADAMRGIMTFPPHFGRSFPPLVTRNGTLNEQAKKTYNRLLEYIRDFGAKNDFEFQDAFARWVDNNIQDSSQGPKTRAWFEKYRATFKKPAMELTLRNSSSPDWLLFQAEGLSPEEAIEFLTNVVREEIDANPKASPDAEAYKPALLSIYRRDPAIQKNVESQGGIHGWVKSYFSREMRCRREMAKMSQEVMPK